MEKTATAPHIPETACPIREASPRPSARAIAVKILSILASLRITVTLFALALFLVFVGTLAQRFSGNWTVVNSYFRSALVWIPFQVFFPEFETVEVPGVFPFPGGWLLGGVLLVNLLAAHAIRFKMTWKRSGILVIHAGIVLLMVSELMTGLGAVEGRMAIVEGRSSNFLEEYHDSELAVVDVSDPKLEDVVVVPRRLLRKGGTIQHPDLPFDVEVIQFMENSRLATKIPAGFRNPATAGTGLRVAAFDEPEVSGTDQDQPVDAPSAYVTLKKKGDSQGMATYLVSLFLQPQKLTIGDKAYEIALRPRRTYRPYTIHLLEFRHDRYLGTDIPRNFSSRVRVVDPERQRDFEVLISMNDPLRHRGETFYQSSTLPGDIGTVLQVVRNPGWLLPYISCVMVSLGMIVHFGLHLVPFLRKRMAT